MSYDIYLVDPVTKDRLCSDVVHDMRGGTYAVGGTKELWLNITYNYAKYYYEAAKDGIRGIYGKTAAESIPILQAMIDYIESKYKDENGNWIISHHTRSICLDENGEEIDIYHAIINNIEHTSKEEEYDVSEGDTGDYWESTAANALRPLYQLIAMAKIRPDGIWEGD